MDESHRSPAPGTGGDPAGSTPANPSVPSSGNHAGYPHDSAHRPEAPSPWAAPAANPSAAPPSGGYYSHGPQNPEHVGPATSPSGPAPSGPPAGPYPSWSNAGVQQNAQPTTPLATYPPSARPARKRGPLAAAVVGGALVLALVAGGAGAAVGVAVSGHDGSGVTISQTDTEPASKTDTTNSVESAAGTALKSVVTIEVSGSSGSGTGSGVVLDGSGHILTNNHVVEEAASGGTVIVVLPNGTQRQATIVGRDPSSDIAVVKVSDASGLTPATFAKSSTVKVGQTVLAIGAPLGLSNTVTEGIVSALNRPVRTSSDTSSANAQNTVLDAVQTDAAINPGNSGGALVDLSGRVVGINSAIATVSSGSSGFGGQQESQSGNIGVGFAIPADTALNVAKQLIQSGTAVHATLGVSAQDTQSGTGAQIQQVTGGSGAAKAGLKAGDVVTAVGSRQITDTDALVAAVRSHSPGESVTVTYQRGGKTSKVTVKLSSSST